MSATVEQRVLVILRQQATSDPREITATTRLIADLAFDSLDTFEVTMQLEDEFRLNLKDDDISRCITVADVVATVTRAIAHSSGADA